MRFEPAMASRSIGAALLAALSVGCASTAMPTDLPVFTGHVSVPSGATATLNNDQVALGLATASLTNISAESLLAALKRLRAQHNKAAEESFTTEPDTLALRVAPATSIENVRRLVAASRNAGFRHLAIVGQTPGGQVTALKLLGEPPSGRGVTHLALRWGTRKPRSELAQKTDGTAWAGIEVATIQAAAKKSGTRNKPLYAVQRGESVNGEATCPAVPVDIETQEPDLTAVAPIATRACQQSEDGNAILVAPSPATSWGEVLSVANAASSAEGCRSALFIEPETSRPIGCNTFVAKPSNRRDLKKRSSKILGILSGSGQLSKALMRGAGGSLVIGKGTGGILVGGGGRVVGLRGGGGGGAGAVGGGGRLVHRRPTDMLIMGNPVISGPCDKSLVSEILRRRMGRMRQCFQKVTGRGGKVDLQLAIDRKGKVKKANLSSKWPAAAAVGTCVTRTARRLRFPRPAGKQGCKVDVALTFKRPPPPKQVVKPKPTVPVPKVNP